MICFQCFPKIAQSTLERSCKGKRQQHHREEVKPERKQDGLESGLAPSWSFILPVLYSSCQVVPTWSDLVTWGKKTLCWGSLGLDA